jgi:guanyl-specific ribonuclease Sa
VWDNLGHMRPSGRARSIAVRASASGFAFALGLLAVLCVWHASAPPAIAQGVRAGSATAAADGVDVPRKARDVLAEIQRRNGVPPPGYVGGRAFGNRERHLPRGTYREYDVNPRRPGKSRGTERIVIEQRTGKAYYSPDHYQTFRPMN